VAGGDDDDAAGGGARIPGRCGPAAMPFGHGWKPAGSGGNASDGGGAPSGSGGGGRAAGASAGWAGGGERRRLDAVVVDVATSASDQMRGFCWTAGAGGDGPSLVVAAGGAASQRPRGPSSRRGGRWAQNASRPPTSTGYRDNGDRCPRRKSRLSVDRRSSSPSVTRKHIIDSHHFYT